jgi:hypothetical protein
MGPNGSEPWHEGNLTRGLAAPSLRAQASVDLAKYLLGCFKAAKNALQAKAEAFWSLGLRAHPVGAYNDFTHQWLRQ